MKEIYQSIIDAVQKRRSFVLATLIATKGSAPQKPGAKMLIFPDGKFTGTVGGGCAEGDVWYQAKQLFSESTKQPVLRRYTLNEDLAAESGMVCGGTMTFLLEPFPQPEVLEEFLPFFQSAIKEEQAFIWITAVKSPSANIPCGHRWVLEENGHFIGPELPADVHQFLKHQAQELFPFAGCRLVTYPDGSQFFLENVAPAPRIVLIGAGHINQAVAQLAPTLRFHLTVIDDREQFANTQRFPNADSIIVAPVPVGIQQAKIQKSHFILIATRGHKLDDIAVQEALKTPAQYIGLVGSRRKVALIQKKLSQQGIAQDEFQRLHAPVGLDIGAVTPQEIAISILAEMIQFRRGGSGVPLREKYRKQLQQALQS